MIHFPVCIYFQTIVKFVPFSMFSRVGPYSLEMRGEGFFFPNKVVFFTSI